MFKSIFKESKEILNSTLLFVFLPFFIGNLYLTYMTRFTDVIYFGLSTLAFTVLKSFFSAAIYGSLCDLCTGQYIVLSSKQLKNNALKFWNIYFLLSLTSFLTYSILSTLITHSNASHLPFLSVTLNILINVIFLSVIIYEKLYKPFGKSIKDIQIPLTHGAFIILLYCLEFCLRTFLQTYMPKPFYTTPSMLLGSQYIHLLAGTFLIISITYKNQTIKKQSQDQKEIYLVNPVKGGIFVSIASLFQRITPPSLFAILEALTPCEYRVLKFSSCLWHKRYYAKNKLVAITCLTPNSYEAYTIAKKFKASGSKVVLGGPHVSYFADEALEYCDSVVIGEAEAVWEDIVNDFKHNKLQKIYQKRPNEEHYQRIFDKLVKSDEKVIKSYIETTSGCKFKCDFCAIPGFFEGQVRSQAVDKVVTLVKKISKRYKRFTFIDNNIYSDPGYARELFTKLKPLKIKWSSQCTIDIAKNEKTLQLAKESGCEFLLCGFEITEKSKEQAQKGKFSIAQNYIALAKNIKKKGIKLKGNFIFGFESDSLKSLIDLWLFCFKMKPAYTILYFLTPMPGSKLFIDMIKSEKITNLNWRHYTCGELLIKHKNLNTNFLNRIYPMLCFLFITTTSTTGFIIGILLLVTLLDILAIQIFGAALFNKT